MHFEEILDQAIAMLQRRGRVTYRTLSNAWELRRALVRGWYTGWHVYWVQRSIGESLL